MKIKRTPSAQDTLVVLVCSALLLGHGGNGASAQEADKPSGEGSETAPETLINVREYRVRGGKLLGADEIGAAVYPYLGPYRSVKDIDEARAALEKVYKDKGYQTVVVDVPEQSGRGGIIYLEVVENQVGRLRVRGARYFLTSDVKRHAPSLAEGSVPNFNEVTKDIVGLNRMADRRVTPELMPGREAGTVDIDLNVEDKLPLHGSLELNNRYNADTVPLRLNGSLSYSNLWQLGHSLGFNFQIAPERLEDATVYSAYYMARVTEGMSLMFMGTQQDSDISTLGGVAVAGRGQILGFRTIFDMPSKPGFYQSISFGMDYKRFEEDITVGDESFSTPIDYYPFALSYGASWNQKKHFTELNSTATFHVRGMGDEPADFDAKRFRATGSFFHLRSDLSHTHDLPGGLQIFGKVQGQAADQPLINTEQFAVGGLSTVRGYLESAAIGDNAIGGTLELRTPSLIPPKPDEAATARQQANEWRFHAFVDAMRATLHDPLPDQVDTFDLASWGFGSRLRVLGHLNGSVDVSFPLISQGPTLADDVFVSFRLWADF
jgi:hemolysin activation/secretion protein